MYTSNMEVVLSNHGVEVVPVPDQRHDPGAEPTGEVDVGHESEGAVDAGPRGRHVPQQVGVEQRRRNHDL